MWELLQTTFDHPGITLVAGLIGFLVGNRLTLARDKRREFNEIIEPIRTILFRERKKPLPYTTGINEIDILNLREALPFWKRRRFDGAIEKYKESKGGKNIKKDSCGQASFKDIETIIHAINTLLKFIKKK